MPFCQFFRPYIEIFKYAGFKFCLRIIKGDGLSRIKQKISAVLFSEMLLIMQTA
jgi:hypothetical protein